MKKRVKSFMVLVILFILLVEMFPINISNAETSIGSDALISLNIKGVTKVIKKTTTIDEIKSWYAGEHIFETPSLFGGTAYSFYVGDKFESYLYIETIKDGTIFSYGSVDKSYKTNTYSYGDKFPYNLNTELYGCLLSDDGIITGGVYYNKSVYLNGKSKDIIADYRKKFETAYAKENQIEISEIGTEKDKRRQSYVMLDMNKHATLMYNGMIHQYGRDESFMQTDRNTNGKDTFKTVEEYFYINNQFLEFGTSLFAYLVNMGYGSSYYNSLGSKSNCDLAYKNSYVFNPLQLAGMAKLQKNKNLSTRNIPVWSYNYADRILVGISFNKDSLKRYEDIEYTAEEKSKLNKGREYYKTAISQLYESNEIYKTKPVLNPPESMKAGELTDSKKNGILNYFNAIRAAAGLGTVTAKEDGFNIAQHMTTLLAYRFRYLNVEKFLTHLPEQPEGVSRAYWERAVGWETSWGNSLSYASRTVTESNMIYHINSLLYDNDGSIDYGHRRHLLHPGYSEFGFGISEFFAEVNLNGYQPYDYVCNGWPAPNGITFLESLATRKFDWSVAFDRKKYLVQNSTTAIVKCLNTGTECIFDKEESNVQRLYENVVEGENIDSLINKIVMYDKSIDPMAGYVYQITIKGLKNVRTGKIEDYTYRVIFDYADVNRYPTAESYISIEPDKRLEQNANTFCSGKVGETYKLNAILTNNDIIDKKVTWESSNPDLVSVKQDGTITINKKDGEKTATIQVYFDGDNRIDASIIIKPQDVSLICDNKNINNMAYTFKTLNEKLQLSVHLSNGEKTTFTYKSSNESILKINKTGVVTSVGPGYATVTITDNKYGKYATIECFVMTPVTLSNGQIGYIGDMNRDGFYNAVDASMILDAFKGNPTQDAALLGDVNGDGYVNAVDSALILDFYKATKFSPGSYAKDISKLKVEMVQADIPYTGSPIKKEITVQNEDEKLIDGVEYTVEYKNNVDVGTASVIINGSGDYEGKIVKTFKIVKPTSKDTEKPVAQETMPFESTKYKIVENAKSHETYVVNVNDKDTAKEALKNISLINSYKNKGYNIKLFNIKNKELTESNLVGTGAYGKINTSGNNYLSDKKFIIIKYGDVTGDGKINVADALAIVKNNLGKKKFTNDYFTEAGRVSKQTRKKGSIPGVTDALMIVKYSLKKVKIEQYYEKK